jgi:hypothetical protein
MNITSIVRERLGADWIPAIYSERIRPQRTRAYHLDIPARENDALIMHTLLGVELKVGKRRFACPDLSTARYLRVFARLGSTDFAVPYDITKIAPAADELEMSWHRGLLILESELKQKSERSRSQYRSSLIRDIRNEIIDLGAGELMPAFDRPTRQRGAA